MLVLDVNCAATDISEIQRVVLAHDGHASLATVMETLILTPWVIATGRRVNVLNVFTTQPAIVATLVWPASLAMPWPSTKVIAGPVSVSAVVLCSCRQVLFNVTKLADNANVNRTSPATIAIDAKMASSTWKAEMDAKHATAILSVPSIGHVMFAVASVFAVLV